MKGRGQVTEADSSPDSALPTVWEILREKEEG